MTTGRLSWVKRRARRIQQFYRVSRREAVCSAWLDWLFFLGAAA